jgi:hypothetical protein
MEKIFFHEQALSFRIAKRAPIPHHVGLCYNESKRPGAAILAIAGD